MLLKLPRIDLLLVLRTKDPCRLLPEASSRPFFVQSHVRGILRYRCRLGVPTPKSADVSEHLRNVEGVDFRDGLQRIGLLVNHQRHVRVRMLEIRPPLGDAKATLHHRIGGKVGGRLAKAWLRPLRLSGARAIAFVLGQKSCDACGHRTSEQETRSSAK